MIKNRKAELKSQIARYERELAKLDALPDFEALVNGTVMALTITLGRSRPYVFIGFKVRDRWYLTGSHSPNAVTSDELAEWLTISGRRLVSAVVLAEIETVTVSAVDLGALLGASSGPSDAEKANYLGGYKFCELPDCYCNGDAH